MNQKLPHSKPYCLNCQAELRDSDKFCSQCGQNRKNFVLELKDVISQLFISVFNLDNTFFRSVILLITPWKLTQQYVAGARVPYYHPGRIFIVLLFLLFSILMFFNKDELNLEIGQGYFVTEQDFLLKDSLENFAASVGLGEAEKNNLFKKIFRERKIPHDSMVFTPFLTMNLPSDTIQIPLKEVLLLPLDSIYAKYRIQGFWDKLYLAQSFKFYKKNNDFIYYFIKNILWTIPFTVVIIALFMMLLYLRNKYFYIEHLVFLMHLHASIFLIFILLFLSNSIFPSFPGDISLFAATALIIFIIFFSFLRYYGQGIFKTIVKLILVFFAYIITIVIGAFAVLLISVFIF